MWGDSPAPFVVSLAVFVFASIKIHNEIGKVQPDPYLDEVFHVPQTQAFCNGSFRVWDDKITTLPGTYVFAAALVRGFEAFFLAVDEVCSVGRLRMFNILVGMLNMAMFKNILTQNMKVENNSRKIMLSVFNLSIFPLLFFFNFLFYTDVLSTFLVLAMHSLCLDNMHMHASFMGMLAIFTRQTNVVWVAFHPLILTLDRALTIIEDEMNQLMGIPPKKRGRGRPTRTQRMSFQRRARRFIENLNMRFLPLIMSSSIWYMLVVGLFCVFVYFNGGVAVGDKTAHQISINLPQMGYFALVSGFFFAPFFVTRGHSTLRCLIKYKDVTFYAILFFLGFVYFNTDAHPYLLSDNRHYPFYLWQRVYQNVWWARYALIPFYVFVWGFILEHGSPRTFVLYGVSLVIANFIQLVPQKLLEFRYFIPGYLFARMGLRNVTWFELISELLFFISVNIFTFYMFINKPFKWPNSDEMQRFMW